MPAFLFSVAAALAALAGGRIALGARKNLELGLGLTAGVFLGLVAFDLLPEIFELSAASGLDPVWPMITFTVGFLLFHVAEKFILVHQSHEDEYSPHKHRHVGMASVAALATHSFLDGAAIGLGFAVSNRVGLAVAIAVIAHRFADGFNIVNLMLAGRLPLRRLKQILVLAAAMPVAGMLSTGLFSLSSAALAVYLGFFAGFLLYIGASDILPQAHSKGSSKTVIGLTVLGVVLMFGLSRLA